jgi:hypothetical protein
MYCLCWQLQAVGLLVSLVEPLRLVVLLLALKVQGLMALLVNLQELGLALGLLARRLPRSLRPLAEAPLPVQRPVLA